MHWRPNFGWMLTSYDCVVPENIHPQQPAPPPAPHNGGQQKFRGEGDPKTLNFSPGGGWLLDGFFPGTPLVKQVSFQRLTAALLSWLSVILLLTVF